MANHIDCPFCGKSCLIDRTPSEAMFQCPSCSGKFEVLARQASVPCLANVDLPLTGLPAAPAPDMPPVSAASVSAPSVNPFNNSAPQDPPTRSLKRQVALAWVVAAVPVLFGILAILSIEMPLWRSSALFASAVGLAAGILMLTVMLIQSGRPRLRFSPLALVNAGLALNLLLLVIVGAQVIAPKAAEEPGKSQKSVEDSRAELTKPVGEERRNALLALGKLGAGGEATLGQLVDALRDSDPAAQAAAAEALGMIGPKGRLAYYPIVHLIDAKDERVTKAAFEAVRKIGPPTDKDIAEFRQGLKYTNAALRVAAVQGLRHVDAREAVPDLQAALKDPDIWVRLWAADTLGSWEIPADELMGVLTGALKHVDPQVRLFVTDTLLQMGPRGRAALPAVLAQLKVEGNNVELAAKTARALGAMEDKEAAPILIDLLRNKKEPPLVRAAAAEALGQLGAVTKESMAALADAVRNRSEDGQEIAVCVEAAGALKALKQDESNSLAALRTALKHSVPAVRIAAAQALGQIDPQGAETVAALRQALEAKDAAGEVAGEVAGALGSGGPAARAALPELRKALSHGMPRVRAAAVHALGQIGVENNEETLAALIKTLDDADADVCLEAVLVLQASGPEARAAVPGLRRALKRDDPILRAAVAATLGKIGPPAKPAVPDLIKILKKENTPSDADGDVRAQALITLGAIGPDAADAVPLLNAALTHKDANMRMRAAYALGGIGLEKPGTVDGLTELLRKDPDAGIRVRAASALGAIKPKAPAAVQALGEGLAKDKSNQVRRAAAVALGFIGGPQAIKILEAAREDADPEVQEAALDALKGLQPDEK